jgi:hypothetical protein
MSQRQPMPLRRLWWLNPSWVFGMVTVGTFVLALSLSERSYDLYDSPKYLRMDHWWIPVGAWLALECGRRLGANWQQEPGDSGDRLIDDVNWWFWASFVLTVGAYFLLLVRGLQNGLSLSVIKENLFAPPNEVSRELAGEVVVYLPGVTTATQFGIICVLLGLWLYFRGRRQVMKYVAIVVGLAAMRALLFHERLALIEGLPRPSDECRQKMAPASRPHPRPGGHGGDVRGLRVFPQLAALPESVHVDRRVHHLADRWVLQHQRQ